MKIVVVDEGKALVFFFRQDFIFFLSTLRWKQLTRERTKTDL